MIKMLDEGIMSISETEYEEIQFELESASYAIELLKWRISLIIEENGLGGQVNEHDMLDTSWDAITTYRVTIDPAVISEEKKWHN